MNEKKTELALSGAGIASILVMLLPVVGATVKAIMDSGLVAEGSHWYMVLGVIAAAVGAVASSKIATDYTKSRTTVKVERAKAIGDAIRPTRPLAQRKRCSEGGCSEAKEN